MGMKQVGEMLLPAIAYGDAAGVPVETKSYNYIATKYGYLDKLIPTTDNLYFQGEWPVGKTSDDTQLSVAVTRALIRANGFDLSAIASDHVVAYNETPNFKRPDGRIKKLGWGGATTGSIEQIIAGISPFESGSKEGTGNGVLMKMAPLVYWQVARGMSHQQRYEQYDQLTSMTHDNDAARICTRVHGDVLDYLLTDEYHPWTFGDLVMNIANYHEKSFGTTSDITNALQHLTTFGVNGPSFNQLKDVYADRMQTTADDTEFGKSYSFYSPETLAAAYGTFLHGAGDFHKSIYTAVNLGGDADSTASIVGAMYDFAWKGNFALPSDSEKIQNIDELAELSARLARIALRA